ncbi:hypothetical protein FACS1894202_08020 [Clostridia bacterium]|nr:hypothetical protein FACS1894202_08020 [Clostridia bacterium]
MEQWQDHYSTLQVHPDAEIEVIQSAYKRLVRKYHPDINPSNTAAEKIKTINLAYEALSDERNRRVYHNEWVRRVGRGAGAAAAPRVEYRERVVYVNREPPPAPKPVPKADPVRDQGTQEARDVLKNYFNFLAVKNFKAAFGNISELDKRQFNFTSFSEWQESVTAIYQVAKFKIDLFRRHDDLKIDPNKRYRAEEFKISMAEKDLRTGRISEYSFTKFAVCEEGQWHVYLGYRDLTPLLVQFKTMATTQEEAVLRGQWETYRETHNLTLGLANRKGFEEFIAPEVYRYKRYDRPFSVAVFQATIPDRMADRANRDHIMKYVGYIIDKSVRLIDHVAWLEDDLFGIMFAETDRKTALYASRRILRAVRHDVAACFDFEIGMKIGVTPYSGADTDEMIGACLRTIGASGASASA